MGKTEINPIPETRKRNKWQLFQIFLKTGRRRVTLSVICGTLIFLAITGLVMVVYTYRFDTFQSFQKEKNWFSDGLISISSNKYEPGVFNLSASYIENITQDYTGMVNDLFPDIKFRNQSTALSTQIYTFDPTIPGEPWLNHEIMTFDNRTYTGLIQNITAGRLPQNHSEILYLTTSNNQTDFQVNDTITLYSEWHLGRAKNYTIVGLVGDMTETFENESLSLDLFSWNFEGSIVEFFNYYRYNTFVTNSSLYTEILNNMTSYEGVQTYLVDVSYDSSAIKPTNWQNYIYLIPELNDLLESAYTESPVLLCQDLKLFLIQFNSLWTLNTTKLLPLNAPLLFIVGLLSVVTLNIGSRELGAVFRKMKLYGISYRSVRRMVFFENLIFTFVSFVVGTSMGFGVSYLFTMGMESQPSNYYLNFLLEPLLLMGLGTIIIGFFGLSFYIQNAIAKKTTQTTPEEFKEKRGRIRRIFSTNEFRLFILVLIFFRLFILVLIFTIVSISLFMVYRNLGEVSIVVSSMSYLTLFWFMITCTVAFLLTFTFLIIARIISMFWAFISKSVWPKRLNLYSLSIQHLSVYKKSYQLAVLGVLLFGLLIVPGLTMNKSLDTNIGNEVNLKMGDSHLLISHWVDPSDVKDVLLENISEISSFTEAEVYTFSDENEDGRYPNSFRVNIVSLENVTEFLEVIDNDKLKSYSSSVEDVLALEDNMTILGDVKFKRNRGLKPGDAYFPDDFLRFPDELTFINSFRIFPLTPYPTNRAFVPNFDTFSIVAKRFTAREIARSIDFSTDFRIRNYKLINAVNDSAVSIVQEKLADLNFTSQTYQEIYDDMYSGLVTFPINNILIFAILAAVTIIFVSYFTGLKIYDERGRIIESLYRVGAVRGQILAIFTFEYFLVVSLPLLITVFASLPLFGLVADFFLESQSYY
ncbi:MAG: FtsX-like permease family protein, partial [Candidatus Heimdallarchaeota archaeon]